MANLTPERQRIVDDASRRYCIGTDAFAYSSKVWFQAAVAWRTSTIRIWAVWASCRAVAWS